MPDRSAPPRRLRRHLVQFAASLALPLLALLAMLLWWASDSERLRFEDRMRDTAGRIALRLDAYYGQHMATLRALTLTPELADDNLPGVRRLLGAVAEARSVGFVLRGEDGEPLIAVGAQPLPVEALRPALDTALMGGTGVVTHFRREGERADVTISLVVDAPRIQGRRRTLSLQISAERAQAALVQAAYDQLWAISIADADGMLLARTRDPEQWVGRPATAAFLQASSAREAGIWHGPSHEGRPLIGAFARMERTGWAVAVGAERRTVLRPVWRSTMVWTAVTLAVIVLALLLAGRFGARLSAPMVELSRRIREGLPIEDQGSGAAQIREIDEITRALTEARSSRRAAITALSHSEAELQTRMAELARAQRISHLGSYQVELGEGRFRNQRSVEYLSIHGLPADAVNEPHEAWVSRIHPDDRARAVAAFEAALAGTARDYENEYRIIRASDGEVRWVKVLAEIDRDENGTAVRLFGTHRDVTDRKGFEAMLEGIARRQSFLLALSDAWRRLDNPNAVLSASLELLARHLGANRVGLAEDCGDGEWVEIVASFTVGVAALSGRYRYADYRGDLRDSFLAGSSVVRADIMGNPHLTKEQIKACAALEVGATVNKPLLQGGQLKAVLFVHVRERHDWTQGEIEIIDETAERIWTAYQGAKAEQALRESEARFRSIFDNVGASLWEQDLSAVSARFASLRAEGIVDLRAFLAGAPERLDALVAGVVVRDVNPYTVALFEAPSRKALFSQWLQVLTPAAREALAEQFVALWEGRRHLSGETESMTLKGRALHLAYTISFDGPAAERTLVSLIDLTAQKREETTRRAAEARLALALQAAGAGVWEWSAATGVMRIADAAEMGAGTEGLTLPAFIDAVEATARPADREQLDRALRGGGSFSVEYARPGAGVEPVWFSAIGVVELDANGQPHRAHGVRQDITERKRREEQVFLLMREVNHRANNLLSVVLGIARQTQGDAPSEFVSNFEKRIEALVANQRLLVRSEWRGVELPDLVDAQLAPFGGLGGRITRSGPVVLLRPEAAQAIGMALHELATNAAKYGALSDARGRIAISWCADPHDPEGVFFMEWLERGGPTVRPPRRRGFGSKVISAMVRMSLGGEVELAFEPEGLRWSLRCPMRALLHAGGETSATAA